MLEDRKNKLIENLKKAGEEKAIANGERVFYENNRHAKLAELMSEYAATEKKPSEAKLDRLARSDDRYVSYLKDLSDAVQRSVRADTNWDILMAEKVFLKASLDQQLAELNQKMYEQGS